MQAEILKIMGFWLQLGVSGFRMDAVPFVIASEGARPFPRSHTEHYDMLRTLREFLQWRTGDAIILGRGQRVSEDRYGIFRRLPANACR